MDIAALKKACSGAAGSSPASGGGLRRSPTLLKLAALQECEEEALSATDSEEDDELAHAAAKLKQQKPPRHRDMPVCVQSVLRLWKRILQRDDVSVMSDFFKDLDGSQDQAFDLVESMQLMGINITMPQFLALPQRCIYRILTTAL